jgi:TonB family protein
VERNWIPGASTSSRRTVVTFTIGRGGELSNVGIAQSSGNPQTDSAALAAIQRTTMEPLPAEYTGSSVAINFTFDLNVLGGGISTQ